MYFLRKLKSPALNYESLIGILLGVIFLFLLAFVSFYVAFGFASLFLLVYGIIILIVFLRTLNSGYFVLTLSMFINATFCASISILGITEKSPVTIFLAVCVIFVNILLFIMVVNRKLKWRSREILELAALPVKDTSNGFTSRPLPVGKAEFTKNEIMEFARFMHSNLIAIPFAKPEKVVFSITTPLSRQIGINRDYYDGSWVAFNMTGEVSVMISQKDYFKYRDTFSFDQLCENLGSVFVDFLDLFVKGEGIRIIDRMNTLRLNPITE